MRFARAFGAVHGGVLLFALVAPACGGKTQARPAADAEAKQLFAATCAKCHGAEGAGGPPANPGEAGPRSFRDAAFQSSHTDAQLQATIKDGKPPSMPSFGALFTDEQMRGLVTVVRSFDPGH